MDMIANQKAISYIWDCVTVNASIKYLSPLHKNSRNKKEYDFYSYLQFQTENKVWISVRLEMLDDDSVIAYWNFLFIKRK